MNFVNLIYIFLKQGFPRNTSESYNNLSIAKFYTYSFQILGGISSFLFVFCQLSLFVEYVGLDVSNFVNLSPISEETTPTFRPMWPIL